MADFGTTTLASYRVCVETATGFPKRLPDVVGQKAYQGQKSVLRVILVRRTMYLRNKLRVIAQKNNKNP